MKALQQRGLEMAANFNIFQKPDGTWSVPSATSKGHRYTVQVGQKTTCTCQYHEINGAKCKHAFAVEYFVKREQHEDGSETITETLRVTESIQRKTYPQNWPAYNAAQCNEKPRVLELLKGLCDGIAQPPQKRGRPRLALSDVAFSAVMKVYSTVSGRRASSEIDEYVAKGFISKPHHYNSVFTYLENPALTPILKAMVEESASPLKVIESDFAADSSGFATSTYVRWYDEKYGKIRSEHTWIKAHIMIGVRTNLVTRVEVTDQNSNDYPHLPKLLATTAKRFEVSEVSADKGYLGRSNLEAIVNAGAVPYIPFKSNVTGEGPELWRKLFHFFQFNRKEFLEKYHKRSNVETTFSMIKAKFGASLRSRTQVAQMNELLCKIICHNLCVLTQSMYELGIDPVFWKDAA
jgi:transposase